MSDELARVLYAAEFQCPLPSDAEWADMLRQDAGAVAVNLRMATAARAHIEKERQAAGVDVGAAVGVIRADMCESCPIAADCGEDCWVFIALRHLGQEDAG